MSPKWETIFIFTLLLPSPPPPLHQLPKKEAFYAVKGVAQWELFAAPPDHLTSDKI